MLAEKVNISKYTTNSYTCILKRLLF